MSTVSLPSPPADAGELKACCGDLWSHPAVQLLAGDAFRPGGTAMTATLIGQASLSEGARVLDIGSGTGATLRWLIEHGHCPIGIDYSPTLAQDAAAVAPVSLGDGEALPFLGESFDAVLAECVMSVLPRKRVALAEVHRVLRPGSTFVMSDVTVGSALPPELDNLLGWAACAAGALPADQWADVLVEAGFELGHVADCQPDLQALIAQARRRLAMIQGAVGTGIVDVGIEQFALPGIEQVLPGVEAVGLEDALAIGQDMLGRVAAAVEAGDLGYVSIIAARR